MKIIKNGDCGNSPKNKFVQDLEIAISRSDIKYIGSSTIEDFEWAVCGVGVFKGQSAIPSALDALNLLSATELSIEYVLSHGKSGATQSLRSDEGGNSQYVSHFFRFNSAKAKQVSRITSMVVKGANEV